MPLKVGYMCAENKTGSTRVHGILYNDKRVHVPLADHYLKGFQYLGFRGVCELRDLFLYKLFDIFGKPWQVTAFCICVTAWVQCDLVRRPSFNML